MSDYRDLKKYYPTLVSTVAGKRVPGEGRVRRERLQALPERTQKILLSDAIVEFIYGVEQRFHLDDAQTEEFSRTVRQYYFRELTEGAFANKIAQLCNISPDDALKLLSTINAIGEQKKDTQKMRRDLAALPLARALDMYPGISEQIITTQPITSKPFLQPLRPTVKNWIMVYEKVLDVSKHSAIERGDFVYRAEATRNLSQKERQNLALLFKSRDEDTNLMIDVQKKEIVFDAQPGEENERMRVMDHEEKKMRETTREGIFGAGTYLTKNVEKKTEEDTTTERAMQEAAKGIEALAQNAQRRAPATQMQNTAQKEVENATQDERVSGERIAQEREALARQTREMNEMMRTMQKTKDTQQPRANMSREFAQKSVPEVRAYGSIQNEIQKNRDEMRGYTQKIPPQKRQEDQSQSPMGHMTFSSKHTLPAEKEKVRTQKTQRNYYHMAPIGQQHNVMGKSRSEKE